MCASCRRQKYNQGEIEENLVNGLLAKVCAAERN